MATTEEDPKVDPKGDPKQEEKQEEKKPDPKQEKGEGESVEELKAKLKAANDEAKKFRLEGKTAKEKADRLEKAWKIANGEDSEKVDPDKLEKQRTESRMKKLLMKSAFVSVAAVDMHDAEHSFDSVASELGDIEVDLEKGSVDKKKIKEAVDGLRKSRPYLFRKVSDLNETKEPKGQKEDGAPKDSANPWATWQNLWKTNQKEATKFYEKNKEAIIANAPK